MGAADAGLQHASAPDRDTRRFAGIVKAARFGKASHAAELDIDDAARPFLDGLRCMMRGPDTLIEADGRLQLRLQDGMVDDIVVRERLLDHQSGKIRRAV